ncbi:response regulator [Fimbriiglobus ruber]|uniref:Response regulatory domain-containing protein n=1 Tax=Fimbriiglobus ruber TaxID=1908690 RepID=A0A225EBA5_9BACT|nr:response regulator [Fimbriiglobus ruber]OWK47306.1 hypothetical protein FRUB_01005 [Fimbriiglobus ruber]
MTAFKTLDTTCCPRAATEPGRKKAPRLVLGLVKSAFAAEVEAYFRQLGWDVVCVADSMDVSRAALRGKVTAVVLAVTPGDESGLLTCAKLRLTRPHARIILVGPEDARQARYARFAGAVGYLPEGTGVAAVARAVLGN